MEKIAFLDHSQELHELRPKRGYLTRDEADRLVRELFAERITQKKIRAFSPETIFRLLQSSPSQVPRHSAIGPLTIEVPGLRFVYQASHAGRELASMHRFALKAFRLELQQSELGQEMAG